MDAIVKIQIKTLVKLLEAKNIAIKLDDNSIKWLADKGYDPIYGARPLKRIIQQELQNKLANLILQGSVKDGDKINVSLENGELMIK
jgi:ATP-dependent Clp protease ATP-binding subunit ClpB